ncbi:putative porin [Myxococcota bacterium]|nr:putative porin [Myxococcota bacterium]
MPEQSRRPDRLQALLCAMLLLVADPSPVSADDLLSRVLERFNLSGDIRLRYAADIDRINGAPDRQRGRLRLRTELTLDVTDEVVAGFQVRTGNPRNPRNPNADFGSDFSSFDLSLSRAFIMWAPEVVPGLQIFGGKMARGFKNSPIYGQLVWDSDLNPEGAEIRYQQTQGEITLGFVGGSYVLHQNETQSETAYLLSAQSWIFGSPTDEFEYGVALGFDGYGNLEAGRAGASDIRVPDPNPGSPKILHPEAFFIWSGLPTPITFAVEYMRNLDASAQNQGWAVGSMLSFKMWGRESQTFYQFQRIDARALYPRMAQDDFSRASNFNGHLFGIRLLINEHIELNLSALFTQSRLATAPQTYEKRFRFDLNFAL